MSKERLEVPTKEEVKSYYFSRELPFAENFTYDFFSQKIEPEALFDEDQIARMKGRFHLYDADIPPISKISLVHKDEPQNVIKFLWFDTSGFRDRSFRSFSEWEILGLSNKTHNVLARNAFVGSLELVEEMAKREELTWFRGFGKVALKEVKQRLSVFKKRVNSVLND